MSVPRLFHVSEESGIAAFVPRPPTRADLDPGVPLVWAIAETRLSNFLTPRNCPRVAYHVGAHTTAADRRLFFSTPLQTHALVLEARAYAAMRAATLYLYEFAPDDFVLQDAAAGYYVARRRQVPIARQTVRDAFSALMDRDVEVRLVRSLWPIADAVRQSTLDWSLCRMAFALPRGGAGEGGNDGVSADFRHDPREV